MAAVLVCVSCGGRAHVLYEWGGYEDSIYRLYQKGEEFDLAWELDILSKDLAWSMEHDEAIPPGKCMHLGYLFSLNSDIAMAIKYFKLEKKYFPESAKFVDGILSRIQKKTNN